MYQSQRPRYRILDRQEPPSPSSVLFRRMTRKELWATLIALVIAVLLFVFFEQHHRGVYHAPAGGKQTQATGDNFNKSAYSNTDPSSIWVVVNKHRQLNPKDYAPTDLVNPAIPLRESASNDEMKVRAATAAALKSLNDDASKQGLHFMLASGYRSYQLQVSVYGSEVRTNGQAGADKESARPGFSEHQTGLAADLEPASRQCEVADCFADTAEGKWLAANAYKYGFIIRYQQSIENITGYKYEPWHVRYVGTALATEMHRTSVLTLEQFFSLGAAPDYQ